MDGGTNSIGYRLGRVEEKVENHDSKIQELIVIAARAEGEMGRMATDVGECRSELRTLRQESEKRREDERDERKADRRWQIGTTLAIITAIIAAAGIVLSAV